MSKQIDNREELASQIATAFKEIEQIKLYQHVCSQHDYTVIKQAFDDTMKVPSDKIKKSRSALFFYLLKKNV